MRLPLLALATLATACVATSSPAIRACGVNGAPAASAGPLQILASRAPGVEIDSAYWLTAAGTQDIGTWEQLNYYSRLRATRRVERDELALLYEAETPHPLVDLEVRSSVHDRERLLTPAAERRALEPGDTTTTVRVIHRDGELTMGRWSSIGYCPRTVRLVPRSEVPFLLMPRLTGDSVRAAAQATANASGSPLVVVKDTVLPADHMGGSSFVGAALNTADTALTDMIVGLIVVGVSDAAQGTATAGMATEDTIEYHVGRVAPRGRIGFVGGQFRYQEGIVERVTYPASRITGRPVPTLGASRRVSDVRRFAAEEASTHRDVQRRASESFATDSNSYTARRGREVGPGVYEHSVSVVVHWTNLLTTPLYLARCSAATSVPVYTVVVSSGAQAGRRSAYSADSSCTAASAIQVLPGVMRVDTLHLRATAPYDPSGLAGLQEPRAFGIFELQVDVRHCPDVATCRVGMPILVRSSRFRIYPDRSAR